MQEKGQQGKKLIQRECRRDVLNTVSVMWKSVSKNKVLLLSAQAYIPYSGKLLREKTFADWSERPFHGENFRRMLKPHIGGYGTPKFHGENFHGWLSNHEIHGSFLPRKFSAMW